jgi:hypothetical protein
VKYAGDLVLLAKGETVLQGMFDRLFETGRSYGMEMNQLNLRLRESQGSSPSTDYNI